MSNNAFRKFVIIFVTLIGAGFGTWAGFLYSEIYFWMATILGIVSGYILSLLYLNVLTKLGSKLKVILFGPVIGIVCGLLSTAFIHGIMTLINMVTVWQSFKSGDIGPFYGLAMAVCHIIGAAAGLFAGLLFSLIYVSIVMGKANEVRNSA